MSDDDRDNSGLVRCRCLFCGNSFWSQRSTAEYCIPAHKQKMYRWRKNLSTKRGRALLLVDDIASYLTYDQSTPTAVEALAAISRRVAEKLAEHNVKIVR